jgi:predicted RND superfamily exporter protein
MSTFDGIAETSAPLKFTLTGASVSTVSGLWGWLGENHEVLASIGVVICILVGLCGLAVQIVNFVAIRRRERREVEAHKATMERLREDTV